MLKLYDLRIWMIFDILNKTVFENSVKLLTHLLLNTRALLLQAVLLHVPGMSGIC